MISSKQHENDDFSNKSLILIHFLKNFPPSGEQPPAARCAGAKLNRKIHLKECFQNYRILDTQTFLKILKIANYRFLKEGAPLLTMTSSLPLPPRRGFATRERITKFKWLPGMQDFVLTMTAGHTVKTAPYADILTKMIGHVSTWTDLTVPKISVIKIFVRS